MASIDIEKAIAGGAGYVDHNNVMQAVNRSGTPTDVRNAARAEEVMFKGPVSRDAIDIIEDR